MAKRIIYPNDAGGIAVIIPTGELPIEDVVRKAVPPDVPYRIVDAAALPTDRTWRAAWVADDETGAVVVDMPKAREVHRARVRHARKPLLDALDVEYLRAVERGDAAEKKRVTAARQALRDAPADPAIEAAETIEQLAALLNAFDACAPAVFRFKDAYAVKGEAARYHLGYVAQTLAAAIQAQGLDPARYAIWCEDALTEMVQVGEAEDGEPIMEERPALDENGAQRTRQGLRYDQFIALMEASHRRRFARLEARIAALEAP